MATTACFSGYTPQLIKALLFEAVFKRLSEASLRSAALAGSIFIDWSFSDKIFVSRRNFLKTIRSPVESESVILLHLQHFVDFPPALSLLQTTCQEGFYA